jgi:hypothetical protein
VQALYSPMRGTREPSAHRCVSLPQVPVANRYYLTSISQPSWVSRRSVTEKRKSNTWQHTRRSNVTHPEREHKDSEHGKHDPRARGHYPG